MKTKTLAAFAALIISFAASAASVTGGSVPKVVPALKEWRSSKGSFKMPSKGSISVGGDSALVSTARILAEDLKAMFGYDYSVVSTNKKGVATVTLALEPADTLNGVESYRLKVGKNVTITAPTQTGVMWGTRTLLQMVHTSEGVLAKGSAVDWPDFPSRGFMLDAGRKFFTMDFLRDYVRILSFYKMNEFQVHLNDNGFPQFFDNDWDKTYAAFRLESDRFPGLTAKDGHYTKQEFIDLQRFAAERGVNIIPEVDIPAHSLAFVHYRPDLGSREYGMDHLDINNPDTYTFVDSLLDEYIGGEEPVFIGKDVHIGTDEYNKKESEKYRYFTDRYLKYVMSYGKTPRMWGGLRWLKGETEVLAKGVTVNAWSYDWVDPVKSLEDGYKLINTNDRNLYIVPGAGYYREFLDGKYLYETWTPWMMNHKEVIPEGTPGVEGAMFAVWNDVCGNGISQKDVHYRAFPAVQVMGEKLWRGKNESVSYDQFKALCDVMPEAPGVDINQALDDTLTIFADTTVTLTGKNTVATGRLEAGYPYAVEFEIKADSVQSNSGVIFQSPNAKFYGNWENTGRLAFSRDGYTFAFPAAVLPVGKWIKIRVEGDWRGTSLYVDGKLTDRLKGRTRRVYNEKYGRLENMYMHETLVFPLEVAGDSINGFKGEIRSLKVLPTAKK